MSEGHQKKVSFFLSGGSLGCPKDTKRKSPFFLVEVL